MVSYSFTNDSLTGYHQNCCLAFKCLDSCECWSLVVFWMLFSQSDLLSSCTFYPLLLDSIWHFGSNPVCGTPVGSGNFSYLIFITFPTPSFQSGSISSVCSEDRLIDWLLSLGKVPCSRLDCSYSLFQCPHSTFSNGGYKWHLRRYNLAVRKLNALFCLPFLTLYYGGT